MAQVSFPGVSNYANVSSGDANGVVADGGVGGSGSTASGGLDGFLLLEDESFILLESGFKILLD